MTISTKTTTVLTSNGITLEALDMMSVTAIKEIKGVGPKRLEEILKYLDSKTVTKEPRVQLFSADDIMKVRNHILANPAAEEALNSKADREVALVSKLFLHQEVSYDSIAHAISSLWCADEHFAVMIGKVSPKMKFAIPKHYSNFSYERMKSILAATILNGLCEIGLVESDTRTVKEVDDNGKATWSYKKFVTFGTEPEVDPMFVKGAHDEPGVVLQKVTKTQVGGKSIKLSFGEKLFLSKAASMPLRLVQTTTREQFKAYFEQTEWYRNVTDGKSQEDPLALKARIEILLDQIMSIQSKEVVYLSMWIDYRTRLYYDLSLLGINPHGKTFETSQWEMAHPELITNCAAEDYFYSAVVIIEGRMAHHTAIEKFRANPDHYLAELNKDSGSMDKDFYNKRLAKAIQDYNNGIPSHFLLGEDATNGGLQHGGIGFKEPKMMISANVGGSPKQEDSHSDLQLALGLETRDQAKPINTELLHGQSIKTTAKNIGLSEAETTEMLISAYGPAFTNIQKIADWGTRAIDNHNTSLMWKCSDGFKAQSIAHVQSVPLTIYCLSGSNKSGWSSAKIHRDMPVLLDAKGQSVYGSVKREDGTTDKHAGGSAKLRGLYANITHSADGTVLRGVVRMLCRKETVGIFKHDNFLTHGNYMKSVRSTYKHGLIDNFDFSVYNSALSDIITTFKGTKPLAPKLIEGNATIDMIENSHYYLAP